jgi:HD-like signal output (HDOD) protein
MSQDEYRQKVFALINLPTLPVIATEILRIIHEDKLSVNQMLPIIERDPPLAMKILKFANSSYYGLQEKVRSLRHAMVVIGMRQLSELSMAFSVLKNFRSRRWSANLPWKSFWEHSAACGHIAQLLVEMLNIRVVNSPYSLGLLHDIGKLVMYRVNSWNILMPTILPLERNNVLATSLKGSNRTDPCRGWNVDRRTLGIAPFTDYWYWISS